MSMCGPDCEHSSHMLRSERREHIKISQPQRVKTRDEIRRQKKRERQNRRKARNG